ncbi:hypothetical protein P175DRAFT_0535064 [Aspergillus ochraceoroseus IBT 24754]|uniref:Uncharacterized protein n=1 Tax=Aspergillus ochraceoroseus IBT 24754 TaxID=1392256 RepID=A0A2T5LPE5_9EURO|nr:uncharacterized protein P175DRAFT_0535064 [Aspergillus ochraceoroseus IBT 24754]PTU18153.1 hypothetical protein P175DRAFT_0535064 [Aspergillus ochraceoroseus IBT 24754]
MRFLEEGPDPEEYSSRVDFDDIDSQVSGIGSQTRSGYISPGRILTGSNSKIQGYVQEEKRLAEDRMREEKRKAEQRLREDKLVSTFSCGPLGSSR